MNEKTAKKIWDNEACLCRVFGGNIRERATQMGVPSEFLDKFEAEDAKWKQIMLKHDQDGTLKH